MALPKITTADVQNCYVQGQPDKLTGTAQQNKAVFDALPQMIVGKHNDIIDTLNSTDDGDSGADNIAATEIKPGGAQTVQGILDDLGDRVDDADRITALLATIQSIGPVQNDDTVLPTAKDVLEAMAAAGLGDMLKAYYDPNNNGDKVAKAENADKLGNKAPTDFVEYADIDPTPTANSTNAVQSGGTYTALDNLNTSIRADLDASNAGSHNAIYRGKFLGNSVTAEQYQAITNGTFDDLYVGDYWTINGHTYLIGDIDYYLRSGYDPNNADGKWGEVTNHHLLIVPLAALDYQKMNSTDTTTGGYYGSEMRTTNMTTAKNIIKTDFGESHILKHFDHLTNAVGANGASGGAWYETDIELMTEWMAYGAPVFHPMGNGSFVPFNYEVGCKQINLFRHRPDLISNRNDWWLRDVVSASLFAFVGLDGGAACTPASSPLGVRPAFCIY